VRHVGRHGYGGDSIRARRIGALALTSPVVMLCSGARIVLCRKSTTVVMCVF
jgi:hypothetical protein